MRKISYAGYRFPPEIIQQAIWLYLTSRPSAAGKYRSFPSGLANGTYRPKAGLARSWANGRVAQNSGRSLAIDSKANFRSGPMNGREER
jgi:hypothetical protein